MIDLDKLELAAKNGTLKAYSATTAQVGGERLEVVGVHFDIFLELIALARKGQHADGYAIKALQQAKLATLWEERAEVYERALREIASYVNSEDRSTRIAREALEKGASK